MIDYALKSGSNEPNSLLRICAQFQKDKPSIENADFLKKEFGTDGRGFKYVNAENTYTALGAAWYDKDGMTLGAGITAQNPNSSVHLSWEQVSDRISVLLENGEFTLQDNIDKSAENELKDVSEKLWYLHQDYEGDKEYFIPEELFKGGFPESTVKISASLTDKNTLQKYIDGLTDLIKDYEQNRDILRFHFHKPKEVLQSLMDLQLDRKEFLTKQNFEFKPQFFITEDEIQKLLLSGSGIQDGKFRINEFFKQEHTLKEKSDFLKHEYGDGGMGRSGFNTWHDSGGFTYSKGSLSAPDAKINMKWNEVAERISKLVSMDKYITQNDIDERIRHAKYTINNRNVDSDFDKIIVEDSKKVLEEYGVTENDIQKSPISRLIEKAQSAGIPVEIANDEQTYMISSETAVFMDVRDESFILVRQVDEGIDYSVYAPDLSLIEGGVWETDELINLRDAASELLGTSKKSLSEIEDYDKFINLADFNTGLDVSAELIKLKNAAMLKAEPKPKVTVNAPENITVSAKTEQKSGVPVTYGHI